MVIEKIATDPRTCFRKTTYFNSGRLAFRHYLESLSLKKAEKILLPSYIGWSEREGSGVFDPVCELNLNYGFYHIKKDLTIDFDQIECMLKHEKINILLIIHYFGYVDPNYERIVDLASAQDCLVIEDEAHALLTDLIGGISGRRGVASILSLHKLLPLKKGGALVQNNISENEPVVNTLHLNEYYPFQFDLYSIAQKRVENFNELSRLLNGLSDNIIPIHPLLREGEIPQTYPVWIENVDRDRLYQKLNQLNIGVVSLYHTLINPISKDEFPESYALSRHIMNLPLHQDISINDISIMTDIIIETIKDLHSY